MLIIFKYFFKYFNNTKKMNDRLRCRSNVRFIIIKKYFVNYFFSNILLFIFFKYLLFIFSNIFFKYFLTSRTTAPNHPITFCRNQFSLTFKGGCCAVLMTSLVTCVNVTLSHSRVFAMSDQVENRDLVLSQVRGFESKAWSLFQAEIIYAQVWLCGVEKSNFTIFFLL